MPYIEGALGTIPVTAAPVAGTNAVQTLTFSGTAVTTGTIVLSLGGFSTAPITVNATAATMVSAIDGALEALPNVGTGGATTAAGTYTAGAGTITVTFAGAQTAQRPMPLLVLENNSMAGGPPPTLAITTTTPGVLPTIPGAARGLRAVNTTTGVLLINTGPPEAQTWVVVGTQV